MVTGMKLGEILSMSSAAKNMLLIKELQILKEF